MSFSMPRGSVTHWIEALKNGDRAAAQPLWERYHARMIGLARQILQRSSCQQADDEDVVQVAFNSFFRGIVGGRFPQLDDRNDLWRLLVLITSRTAIDQTRRARRRGAGHVALLPSPARSVVVVDDEALFEEIAGHEPTPELAAQLIEQYERLLDQLDSQNLRQIAVWKLEGFTNGEIADKLGCSRRTVIRRLEIIRLIWSSESEP